MPAEHWEILCIKITTNCKAWREFLSTGLKSKHSMAWVLCSGSPEIKVKVFVGLILIWSSKAFSKFQKLLWNLFVVLELRLVCPYWSSCGHPNSSCSRLCYVEGEPSWGWISFTSIQQEPSLFHRLAWLFHRGTLLKVDLFGILIAYAKSLHRTT